MFTLANHSFLSTWCLTNAYHVHSHYSFIPWHTNVAYMQLTLYMQFKKWVVDSYKDG